MSQPVQDSSYCNSPVTLASTGNHAWLSCLSAHCTRTSYELKSTFYSYIVGSGSGYSLVTTFQTFFSFFLKSACVPQRIFSRTPRNLSVNRKGTMSHVGTPQFERVFRLGLVSLQNDSPYFTSWSEVVFMPEGALTKLLFRNSTLELKAEIKKNFFIQLQSLKELSKNVISLVGLRNLILLVLLLSTNNVWLHFKFDVKSKRLHGFMGFSYNLVRKKLGIIFTWCWTLYFDPLHFTSDFWPLSFDLSPLFPTGRKKLHLIYRVEQENRLGTV